MRLLAHTEFINRLLCFECFQVFSLKTLIHSKLSYQKLKQKQSLHQKHCEEHLNSTSKASFMVPFLTCIRNTSWKCPTVVVQSLMMTIKKTKSLFTKKFVGLKTSAWKFGYFHLQNQLLTKNNAAFKSVPNSWNYALDTFALQTDSSVCKIVFDSYFRTKINISKMPSQK